jgi:hypothetical protein
MITAREAAKILYYEGVFQNEIARILRKTDATITKWKKTGNWDKTRIEFDITKQTTEDNIWALVKYQSEAINKRKDELEKAGTFEPLKKGDIDALRDLFNLVKGRELEWSNYVKVLREFSAWLKTDNLEIAQKIISHIDKFINEKRQNI